MASDDDARGVKLYLSKRARGLFGFPLASWGAQRPLDEHGPDLSSPC